MREYRLSEAAELDFDAILAFGLEHFSRAQAADYLDGLEQLCETLGLLPNPGYECTAELGRKRRTWRLPYVSHVIYYRLPRSGPFMVRVLHGSQDPLRHL